MCVCIPGVCIVCVCSGVGNGKLVRLMDGMEYDEVGGVLRGVKM